MKAMREHLPIFMDKLNFPIDAKKTFLNVDSLIESNANYENRIKEKLSEFNSNPRIHKKGEFLDELSQLARDMGIHSYTMHLLFYMYCSKRLYERYEETQIPLDIFWNSMLDLRYKLFECYNVYGIWGTFVGWWFVDFFSMERFALGRLQYEHIAFPYERYSKGGFTIHKGDIVYNIHIPSSGPLTRESRMDSYKRAYDFYSHELNGRPLVVVCNSWLLYPDNEKFFPKGSNIIDFLHDFEIIDVKTHDRLEPSWRIFGKDYEKPIDELPKETALQRAYIDWLKAGNKTGNGYGILLFDGNSIL